MGLDMGVDVGVGAAAGEGVLIACGATWVEQAEMNTIRNIIIKMKNRFMISHLLVSINNNYRGNIIRSSGYYPASNLFLAIMVEGSFKEGYPEQLEKREIRHLIPARTLPGAAGWLRQKV